MPSRVKIRSSSKSIPTPTSRTTSRGTRRGRTSTLVAHRSRKFRWSLRSDRVDRSTSIRCSLRQARRRRCQRSSCQICLFSQFSWIRSHRRSRSQARRECRQSTCGTRTRTCSGRVRPPPHRRLAFRSMHRRSRRTRRTIQGDCRTLIERRRTRHRRLPIRRIAGRTPLSRLAMWFRPAVARKTTTRSTMTFSTTVLTSSRVRRPLRRRSSSSRPSTGRAPRRPSPVWEAISRIKRAAHVVLRWFAGRCSAVRRALPCRSS